MNCKVKGKSSIINSIFFTEITTEVYGNSKSQHWAQSFTSLMTDLNRTFHFSQGIALLGPDIDMHIAHKPKCEEKRIQIFSSELTYPKPLTVIHRLYLDCCALIKQ